MPPEWIFEVVVGEGRAWIFCCSSPLLIVALLGFLESEKQLIFGDLTLQTSLLYLILSSWIDLDFMELIGDNLGVKFLSLLSLFEFQLALSSLADLFLLDSDSFLGQFNSGTSHGSQEHLGQIWKFFWAGSAMGEFLKFIIFSGPYLRRPMSFLSDSTAKSSIFESWNQQKEPCTKSL